MNKIRLIIVILFSNFFCFSQNRIIDSLQNILKGAREDTNKVKLLVTLGRNLGQIGDYNSCLHYSQQSLELSDKINFKTGKASSLTNIAICYKEKANYPLSLEYNLRSLEIREQIGDKKSIAASLNNIAIVYKELNDYQKALEYNTRSLKIKEDIKDSFGIAASLNNIAVVYRLQKKEDMALDYNLKALEIREKINDQKGIATTLNNIGNSLIIQKDYKKALEYLFRSLKIREKINDNQGLALSYGGIADAYLALKDPKLAETFFQKCLAVSKQYEFVFNLQEGQRGLSKVYEQQKNYGKALEYYKAFISTKDSIFNEENTKKMVRLEMNYDFDKKEAASKLEQEKKEAVAEAESKKQRIIIWSVCGILVLVVGFAIFAYRSFLQKQKANIEITKQKEIIEEKQKEILDSIHYAKRIQTALLPNEKYFERNLNKLSNNKA